MKKIFISLLLCLVMVVSALSLVGCKDDEWENASSMTNYGSVISNGGFIAETEKYLYYINGFGSYGEDNTFGKPTKGALMAVEKSALGSQNPKTEIVVPKLFVAEDYQAGVYIFNGYVYYGTPSTDLNTYGEVASGSMTFSRTKLAEASAKNTETFFTVDFLNYNYRFLEKGGVVYLIYYNNNSSSLICYNTSTKEEVVIAKEDQKTKDAWESLATYTFLFGEGVDDLVLLYTTNCFSENYFAERDTGDSYTRATEQYNKVYAFVPGDGIISSEIPVRGKCILDGSRGDLTFTVSSIDEEFFFFSAKDLNDKTTTYGVPTSELILRRNAFQAYAVDNANKITNTQFTGGVIVDDDGNGKDINDPVYTIIYGEDTTNENGETVASSEVYVVKTTLTGDAKTDYTRLAKVGTASELIDVKYHGDDLYAYYYNSMSAISRIKLVDFVTNGNEFEIEEKLSQDSVAAAWYGPEFITIGGKDFVFYLDNSNAGGSYVKYIDITIADANYLDNFEAEYDENDDTVIKRFNAKGHKFLGQITAQDQGKIAAAYLDKIGETIEYTVENGVVAVEKDAVVKARQYYDQLSPMGKIHYGNANLSKLLAAEKAVAILEKGLAKLDGIQNYYDGDTAKREAYKNAYNAIKADMEAIKGNKAVLDLIDNNLKWSFYNKGVDLFEPKTETND